MTRAPEGYRPSDLITVPVIVALLIVTAVLGRFELMPTFLPQKPGDKP